MRTVFTLHHLAFLLFPLGLLSMMVAVRDIQNIEPPTRTDASTVNQQLEEMHEHLHRIEEGLADGAMWGAIGLSLTMTSLVIEAARRER